MAEPVTEIGAVKGRGLLAAGAPSRNQLKTLMRLSNEEGNNNRATISSQSECRQAGDIQRRQAHWTRSTSRIRTDTCHETRASQCQQLITNECSSSILFLFA